MAERLYRVDWHGSAYVVAGDASEAVRIAREAAERDPVGAGLDGSAQPIARAASIPKDWLDAIPWGDGAGDRTVAQILADDAARLAEGKGE